MKAKIYNTTNCSQKTSSGRCTVRVSSNGNVSFPVETMKKMQLSESSRVEFIQDAEHPRDWYVSVGNSSSGFAPRARAAKGSRYLILRSKQLTDAIRSSLGFTGRSFAVNVGAQEEHGYWPLITAAVK